MTLNKPLPPELTMQYDALAVQIREAFQLAREQCIQALQSIDPSDLFPAVTTNLPDPVLRELHPGELFPDDQLSLEGTWVRVLSVAGGIPRAMVQVEYEMDNETDVAEFHVVDVVVVKRPLSGEYLVTTQYKHVCPGDLLLNNDSWVMVTAVHPAPHEDDRVGIEYQLPDTGGFTVHSIAPRGFEDAVVKRHV